MKIKKMFGNWSFYKTLILIALPIVLQQVISQFVNLLDNLMVGQLGTADIDAVSIANQFIFIFNLAIFGAISGPSIFATQYHGNNDIDGIKKCIRYKLLICMIIMVIAIIIFLLFDEQLFNLFIHIDEDNTVDPIVVIKNGHDYLMIMLFGLLPFVITEIYSSNLREAKQTVIPMVASLIAVFINIFLNYCLILGHLGFPRLGVKGAAIATIISRYVSCIFIVVYSHVKRKKYLFMKSLYKKILPDSLFTKTVFKKTYILLVNETLWALGMTLVNQCYSLKGLEVVAACNIVSTFTNLFSLVGTSLGNATAILLGQKLGASKDEEALEDSYKFLSSSFIIGVLVALLMILLRTLVPSLYNTTEKVITLSENLIILSAIITPIRILSTCSYFIIRCGGKVYITFLFDSVFTLFIRVPIAFILAKFTHLDIYMIYFIAEITEIVKVIIGIILVKKGIWIHNVTKELATD